MDKFRLSLMIFYLKELSLADEKEEFKKFYSSEVENYLHQALSFSDSNKSDILQIFEYKNSLSSDLKIA